MYFRRNIIANSNLQQFNHTQFTSSPSPFLSQIYIGAGSQLNGTAKNVSMGRMKSIQLGGIKNVWNFGSSSWAFLFTFTLSIFRWSLSCIYFMAVCQILWLCPGIHLSQFLIWPYTFVCLMYISMKFPHILEYKCTVFSERKWSLQQ